MVIFKRKTAPEKMLNSAENQLRDWLRVYDPRKDVLDNVVSGIVQKIKKESTSKKAGSFILRLDKHPPKWLKEIFISEHFDYQQALSVPKEMNLDFIEKTVRSRTTPNDFHVIYDANKRA